MSEIRKEQNAMIQCIWNIVKTNFFGIEEPNNVNRNGIDKQEIVVSPDIAEHYVTPANRCDIILDGEIFSEPEIEYAGDKVRISTN